MIILDKINKGADVATAGNQLSGSLQSQNDAQDSTANLTSGMYDASLEKLIAIALADGVISEKGKQVLFKKAESLGLDLDEFEMVLDARILEVQKSQIRTQANSTPSIQHLLVMLS
ncbi:MAG: hypothetical protein LBK97_06440, partial [Prevotellaceae bacterium]|nr:hypothetical protein [Prevotellaceae bacterium]